MTALEGFPEKYDPAALHATIERALRGIGADAVPLSSTPGATRLFPDPSDARELGLVYPNATGTYGTASDPRLARADFVQGSGQSSIAYIQRFRIKTGLQLAPFGIAPHATPDTAGPIDKDRRVVFGRIITHIPHSFGNHYPAYVFGRSSSDGRRPTCQRLDILGGTANTLKAGYANGEPVRADVDFIPIFAATPDDVRRRLQFLAQLWNGSATTGEHDWSLATGPTGIRYFDATSFPEALASELVTTKTHFAGIVLATTWGWSTWVSTSAYYSGAPANTLNLEGTTARLSDTIQGHDEVMACCQLPDLGKAAFAFRVNPWQVSIALQNIYDDGLRLILSRGSVDFIVGG